MSGLYCRKNSEGHIQCYNSLTPGICSYKCPVNGECIFAKKTWVTFNDAMPERPLRFTTTLCHNTEAIIIEAIDDI